MKRRKHVSPQSTRYMQVELISQISIRQSQSQARLDSKESIWSHLCEGEQRTMTMDTPWGALKASEIPFQILFEIIDPIAAVCIKWRLWRDSIQAGFFYKGWKLQNHDRFSHFRKWFGWNGRSSDMIDWYAPRKEVPILYGVRPGELVSYFA